VLGDELQRAADAGERRLELVADRVREVAEVARAALDGGGHDREVAIQVLNLDRGGGRHVRHLAASGGDRASGGGQSLHGPGDAAGQKGSEEDERREDGDDPEQDLAPILVQPAEQGARGAGDEHDADDATVHRDRARVMDADGGGAAEPFEPVDLAIGCVAADHRRRLAGERRADLRQCAIAAAGERPRRDPAPAVEQVGRGERHLAGAGKNGGEPVRDSRGGRIGGAGRQRLRPGGQEGRCVEVDARQLRPEIVGAGRRFGPRARPLQRGRGGEHRRLRDQLRLGLAYERVLVNAQKHRAEAGQGGDKE
jgi:hypothetical protein